MQQQCGRAIFFSSRGDFLSSSCRPTHQSPLSINISPFSFSFSLSASPLTFPTFSLLRINTPILQFLLYNPNRHIALTSSSSTSTTSTTMSAYKEKDPRIDGIASSIRVVPNFPKPGIMFQDITTLLLNPKAFKNTIDLFVERYKGKNITVVAGVEARGFIFGPPIALAIGAKFVPLRKPRKLPGEVISEEYVLEYGRDCLEMHIGAVEHGDRALVVDDLIATGGTLCAAMKLLERVGAEVVECACVIELPELKTRENVFHDQASYAVGESLKQRTRVSASTNKASI